MLQCQTDSKYLILSYIYANKFHYFCYVWLFDISFHMRVLHNISIFKMVHREGSLYVFYITRKMHRCIFLHGFFYRDLLYSWWKLSFGFHYSICNIITILFANFSHGKNPLSLIYHEKVAKYKIRVIEPDISSIYPVCFSTKIAKEQWELQWNWKASVSLNLCVKNIYILRPRSKKLNLGYVSQMHTLSIW